MTPTPHETKPNIDKENEFDTEELMNNDFFNIQEFISNAAAALIEAAQDATENDVLSDTSSDEEDICLESDNEIVKKKNLHLFINILTKLSNYYRT